MPMPKSAEELETDAALGAALSVALAPPFSGPGAAEMYFALACIHTTAAGFRKAHPEQEVEESYFHAMKKIASLLREVALAACIDFKASQDKRPFDA